MPTLEQLQAQLAQTNAATQRLGNMQVRGSGAALNANLSQLMASQAAAQRLSQQIAQMQAEGVGAGTSQGTAQQRLDEILGNARGDISRYAADPVDAMLMEQLKARATGDGPYNQEVRDSLMTQAGEDAAHVQRNQMANIRGSGDPTDPSVQSQIAEANARRQASLQQARLGIGQVANLANYNAKGQALNQLSGFNQNRQGGQTERERYLNSILGQINDLRQTPSAGSAMSYMQTTTAPAQPVAAKPPTGAWQGFTNGGTYNQTPGWVGPRPAVAPVVQQPKPIVPQPPKPPGIIRPDPNDQPYNGQSPYVGY